MSISINVLIVGDAGVGKTTFITMLERNEFNGLYISTQGMETTNIQCGDITFTVSEFAGQEKYGFKNKFELNTDYDAIIIMYDTTSKTSYKNIDYWFEVINSSITTSIPIILVRNKCDIPFKQPVVGLKSVYMKSFDVSVKKNDGVKEVFDYILGLTTK